MIDTKVWGKHGWIFLHLVSLAYPKNPTNNDIKTYKKFYLNVGKVLPCHKCRINYSKHLKKFPLNDNIFKNRETLVNWLIDIHNCVNEIKGEKIFNYNEAKKRLDVIIENNKCSNPSYNYNLLLSVILSICIIIIIILLKKK